MQTKLAIAPGRKNARVTKRDRAPERLTLSRSPEDAAAFAGVGRDAVYRAMTSGKLKAKKLGRRTLITTEALTAWIESLPDYTSDQSAA